MVGQFNNISNIKHINSVSLNDGIKCTYKRPDKAFPVSFMTHLISLEHFQCIFNLNRNEAWGVFFLVNSQLYVVFPQSVKYQQVTLLSAPAYLSDNNIHAHSKKPGHLICFSETQDKSRPVQTNWDPFRVCLHKLSLHTKAWVTPLEFCLSNSVTAGGR